MPNECDPGVTDRLVMVTWEDTTNVAAWQRHDEMVEWAKAGGWIAHNIGFLVYEDDDCVVVAARTVEDEERHVGLAERIPKRAILKMREAHFDPDDDGK
jgi:hypothetical protein